MSLEEFFALPEAEPVLVDRHVIGHVGLKREGEAYVEPWQSPDGKAHWSVDGRTRRQTYKLKGEV